jgi:hypothetical protein
VFAHAGHWAAQLLYLVPVIVVVIAVLIGRVRGRGEEDEAHSLGDRGD